MKTYSRKQVVAWHWVSSLMTISWFCGAVAGFPVWLTVMSLCGGVAAWWHACSIDDKYAVAFKAGRAEVEAEYSEDLEPAPYLINPDANELERELGVGPDAAYKTNEELIDRIQKMHDRHRANLAAEARKPIIKRQNAAKLLRAERKWKWWMRRALRGKCCASCFGEHPTEVCMGDRFRSHRVPPSVLSPFSEKLGMYGSWERGGDEVMAELGKLASKSFQSFSVGEPITNEPDTVEVYTMSQPEPIQSYKTDLLRDKEDRLRQIDELYDRQIRESNERLRVLNSDLKDLKRRTKKKQKELQLKRGPKPSWF